MIELSLFVRIQVSRYGPRVFVLKKTQAGNVLSIKKLGRLSQKNFKGWAKMVGRLSSISDVRMISTWSDV